MAFGARRRPMASRTEITMMGTILRRMNVSENPATRPPRILPIGVTIKPMSRPCANHGCFSLGISPKPTGMWKTRMTPNMEAPIAPPRSPARSSIASSIANGYPPMSFAKIEPNIPGSTPIAVNSGVIAAPRVSVINGVRQIIPTMPRGSVPIA